MRELYWMYGGKLQHEIEQYKLSWKPFSWLMWITHNAHRDQKKNPEPVPIQKFDPYNTDPIPSRGIKRKMNVERFAKALRIPE